MAERERRLDAEGEVEAVIGAVVETDMGPASEDRGVPGHDQARILARRIQIIRARIAGLTYHEIAQRYGYADGSAARQAILRALAAAEHETVEEYKQLEAARLDDNLTFLVPLVHDTKASNKDRLAAVGHVHRNIELRTRLLGINAPIQIDAPDATGSAAFREVMRVYLSDDELADRIARYRTEHPELDGEPPPQELEG